MQQLKDFIVKYKRYIGAAVIFVVLVLILVNCTGQKNGNSDTQAGTEISGTQATEYQLEGKLQKNVDPELVELIKNYYTAYAAGDIESREPLAQPLSDNEKSYRIFQDLKLIFFWLSGFCSICLLILLNPTISIWSQLGKWDTTINWKFNFFTVLIIVLNFYLYSSRIITGTFRTAIGHFEKDRFKDN